MERDKRAAEEEADEPSEQPTDVGDVGAGDDTAPDPGVGSGPGKSEPPPNP